MFGANIRKQADPPDNFVPPKAWTAWPLPPDIVPREDELVGEDDGLDGCTIKREDRFKPSRVFEDVLIGTTLRITKERLNNREWASEDRDDPSTEDDTSTQDEDEDGDVAAADGSDAPNGVLPHMRHVVSADDDRSRDLLRPTIRHNLSRLDDLLMALHHSRRACIRSMSEESVGEAETANPVNQDESDSDANIASPPMKQETARRYRGRPRKSENPKVLEKENVPAVQPEAKKSNRGRPKKDYLRLTNETDYEYALRIARIRKQPLPPRPELLKASHEPASRASVPSTPSRLRRPTISLSPENQRAAAVAEGSKKRRPFQQEARWNLRDWAEVLGAAAIIGFPQDVVARAAQRCANLFGEGMEMRTLDYGIPPAGKLVAYVPGTIPIVEAEDSDVNGEDEEDGHEDEDEDDQGPARAGDSEKDADAKTVQPKTSRSRKESYWCPVPSCRRSKQGFGRSDHIKRHLIEMHNYSKSSSELEKAVIDAKTVEAKLNGEEIEGGIHVDGFMKFIEETKRGRGKDVASRKRRKGNNKNTDWEAKRRRAHEEDDDESDEEEGEDEEDLNAKVDIEAKEEKGGKSRRNTRRSTRAGTGQQDTDAKIPDLDDEGNQLIGEEMRELERNRVMHHESSGSDFEMGDG